MRRCDAIIIGGGQAGLATSHSLTARGIEHVVLERGRLAERWRSERWDSLRLLSPRWQCQLPGQPTPDGDPRGFMTVSELVDGFESYARSFRAPIETETDVLSVTREGELYYVNTDRGMWVAPNVVVATGHCDKPYVPKCAENLPDDVQSVVPSYYKNPGQLPEGGVLVVGASATGVQLADEIHRSGRPVTIAVGRHTRLPRHYRGQDIVWWLEALGVYDQRIDEVSDPDASRNQPSLQLVGRPDHSTLDLGTLSRAGVRVVGRLRAIDRDVVRFDSDLYATLDSADQKLARLLRRIDRHIETHAIGAPPGEPIRTVPRPDLVDRIDLRAEGISSVVWATGFRRSYPWLHVDVLDARGEIRHTHGVTDLPGLYVLGLFFQTRRGSSFLARIGQDAEDLASAVYDRLEAPSLAA